jgi:two-component system, response regulator PdtaR
MHWEWGTKNLLRYKTFCTDSSTSRSDDCKPAVALQLNNMSHADRSISQFGAKLAEKKLALGLPYEWTSYSVAKYALDGSVLNANIPPQLPNIKVLIVEDETIIAMDMQSKIRQMGCTVVGRVVSGEQAVEQAHQLKPDLVLMDIKLRGKIDGIAAARTIRQTENIPVIFLSAFLAHEKVREEGASLCVAMLAKPFDPFELKEVMISIFTRQ